MTTRLLLGVAAALTAASAPIALHAQLRPADVATSKVATVAVPLASYAKGQQMMTDASKNAALLDINFQFLDKTYENDVYARDPLGNKYRVSCVRFKSTSGFRFKVDQPQFTLNAQGLTIVQNISRITADGLTVKVQFGPCADIAAGVGVRLSDVKLTYRAKPMIAFDQDQHCKVTWSQESDDLSISIGDLNITGVQNDIDKLAKDAVREALNLALTGFYGSRLRGELLKISINVCGGGRG